MSRKITKHINLEEITGPEFLQTLSKKELKVLCEDIRKFILENVSETGGHLSSNLGVVELEVALHYVFSSPNDKLIFDVGHQTYTHKILTGRAKDFKKLRKFGGLSGYPDYKESLYDAWESGHSSTSISALEGFLRAKDHGNESIGDCVAVIGDSAIASGVAFEALNNLSSKNGKAKPIIVLNDNKMGISKTVGSFHRSLDKLRSNAFTRGLKRFVKMITIVPVRNFFHKINNGFKSFIQSDNIFSALGYDYFGPYDGNNLFELIRDFKRAKKMKRPLVIHIITEKGKGYLPAYNDNSGKYHNVAPFDIKTGLPKKSLLEGEYTYTDIVLKTLYKLRGEMPFTIIDPAMILGDSIKEYNKTYPDFILDVGISEEHGAVLASALSRAGEKAVVLYYSTFLQRAYDFVLNDIARQNANVVIGLDRCGVIGPDGSTHQGIYDIAMLQSMPNMEILMPSNGRETREMLKYAMNHNGPIAIRYAKRSDICNLDAEIQDISKTWVKVLDGNVGICITYGPDVTRIKNIIIENNLSITLINARFIRPMDCDMLSELFDSEKPILVYEQAIKSGSLYEKIVEFKNKFSKTSRVSAINISEDTIIRFGEVDKVLDNYGLGDKDILEGLKKLYEN
ncbi:MAG: 1-deoxy-D-xylulose-5-phosphate synthase [Acholeplasmatales bacterium]|nr:1-deoxy-D-xylulose-5-phosphate synthase [Acholeplasmatales bacterium]